MVPELYPEYDTTLLDTAVPSEVAVYNGSYYFDFNKGDFVLDTSNQVTRSSGTDAWVQWCIKAILTVRYACFAYSTDYGSEILYAINTPDRKEAESNIRRTIIETLAIDARTDRVEDIRFDWIDADAVQVKFKVIGIDGQTGNIDVKLGGDNTWRN